MAFRKKVINGEKLGLANINFNDIILCGVLYCKARAQGSLTPTSLTASDTMRYFNGVHLWALSTPTEDLSFPTIKKCTEYEP